MYLLSAQEHVEPGGASGLTSMGSMGGAATPSLPSLSPSGEKPSQHESRLLEYLMAKYNNKVRPVFNASSIVTVHVGITLTQIFDMVSVYFRYLKGK